ncbi:uncharacterized protein SAPINGB_P003897 [Magnusiomyces paraingens]|uniref:ATPase synthesis protein 25 n=1 Tax=Magnusiomyces paraingens TaxID=2606893 RepID=A0A5E8BSS7_9ASCO|nr:uncharacterized protein SAPINGB_P003897 [Saprochaete ingens]VVT54081.1 unnamed protein product [Saprochaete ingens]
MPISLNTNTSKFSTTATTSTSETDTEKHSSFSKNISTEHESQIETSIDSSIPWYMRNNNEDLDQLNSALKEPIPELPHESPESLGLLVEFLVRDLGLTDIKFIDLRDRDPVTVFGPDAIMILATGMNDRHIGKATQSLLTWIKQNHGIVPHKEGIYTAGYIKVQKRRQKKRSKKFAMADETYENLNSRLSTNWMTMDTKVDDIFIHVFTEDKRRSVDLEYVWAKNKKELRAQRALLKEEQTRNTQDHYENSYANISEPNQTENEPLQRKSFSNESSISPFGSNSGSIRKFHTFRSGNLFAAPPSNPSSTSLSDLFKNIVSQSNHSNESTQSSNRPHPTDYKGSEENTPIHQLQLYSFLGNYKKANEIYRTSFSHKDLSQDFDILQNRLNESSEHKVRRHNSNEAILLLLKSHINFLSKLKPSSPHKSSNDSQHLEEILNGIGGNIDQNKIHFNHGKVTLTKNSDVVNSFISCFPYYTTRDHWKLRLIFFQRAHMINPTEFPIDMLVDIAILQQASCEPVDNWDIEFIINSIIHTKQFDKLPFMKSSQEKSKRVFSLLCDTVRPLLPGSRSSSNVPSVNDSMIMLLYRLWTNDKNNDRKITITPSSSRLDPSPFLDNEGEIVPISDQKNENPLARVTTPISLSLYRYLMGEIDITDNITLVTADQASRIRSFLILSLTAFANDGYWSLYWSLCAKIFKSYYIDPEMLHIISALVTKSGDQKAMDFLLSRYIPKLFMHNSSYITPEITEIIKSGLTVLDPNGQKYITLRKYITPRT